MANPLRVVAKRQIYTNFLEYLRVNSSLHLLKVHVRSTTRFHESLKEPLKLGIVPAYHHLTNWGDNSWAEDRPHPASPSEGRPYLKTEVFRGASLHHRLCVCAIPSKEKEKFLLILKKGSTILPQEIRSLKIKDSWAVRLITCWRPIKSVKFIQGRPQLTDHLSGKGDHYQDK